MTRELDVINSSLHEVCRRGLFHAVPPTRSSSVCVHVHNTPPKQKYRTDEPRNTETREEYTTSSQPTDSCIRLEVTTRNSRTLTRNKNPQSKFHLGSEFLLGNSGGSQINMAAHSVSSKQSSTSKQVILYVQLSPLRSIDMHYNTDYTLRCVGRSKHTSLSTVSTLACR